ncbi:MAG: hypothetical protein IJV68_06320 [Clostridia bacterium]|nr:hypothetical protein [Clostridia bacterium]
MNQLNVYYRALLKYREHTMNDRDCTSERNAISRVNVESDKIVLRRNICTVDTDWVDAIENGLVFIEKAIKEERQFIRSNGEVIPIEKVKNVSKSSVEHLAKHSNLITREVEGEDLIPDQLYTVEKLNDYAVYENRFLYMLLCYLRDFITLRYNKILELSNTYQGSMTMNKTVKLPKQTLTYSVNLNEERKEDRYLRKNNKSKDIIDRIDLILKAVLAFISCPLMKLVAKAPMLKPPITKTNVLKMNNNFKQAMALYSFVVAYDKAGYSVETKITELNPFREDLADEMAESVLMASFLTYEYGLGIKNALKEEYEEEERKRKDEEYKRRLEKLEAARRRVAASGEGYEEYIIMLEKQIRTLEGKVNELSSVKEELEKTRALLTNETEVSRRLSEELSQAEATIIRIKEESAEEIRRLTEEHENAMAQLKTEYEESIEALNQAHTEEIQQINEQNEARIEEICLSHKEELSRLDVEKAQLIYTHGEEMNALRLAHSEEKEQINAAHLLEIEQLNGQMSALKNEYSAIIKELEEKNKLLAEEKNKLISDKRVANAHVYALRNQKGEDNGDFTSRQSFDELERTYQEFKAFYKKEWAKTKKSIKKQLLKPVNTEPEKNKEETDRGDENNEE